MHLYANLLPRLETKRDQKNHDLRVKLAKYYFKYIINRVKIRDSEIIYTHTFFNTRFTNAILIFIPIFLAN